jgi:hypothetical protein
MLTGRSFGLETESVLLAWLAASLMEQHSGEKTSALVGQPNKGNRRRQAD